MSQPTALNETSFKDLSAASLDCLLRCVFAHITHEVRQPLVSIGNYSYASEMALSEIPDSEKTLNWIGKISKQVARVDSVLESVRVNMSSGTLSREKFSVWEAVEDAVRLAPDHIWFRQTSFRCTPPTQTIIAEGDRMTFLVALTHLIQNAIESYPINASDRTIAISASIESRVPVISIRDHGCGTIQSELNQLRLPFFSTKTGHRGLGLTVVASVCDQFEGDVAVIPQVDGTIIQLRLGSSC